MDCVLVQQPAPWRVAAVTTVLDQPIGTAGTGIFAGKTLVAGMDFASASAASVIATAAAPKNPLWSSYCYNASPAGAYLRNANQAGLLLHEYDVDIGHTGWNDANGGQPITFDNGAPQQVLALTDSTGSGGTRKALRLHAARQSAAEQLLLNTGNSGQIERGAMAHTLASLWWCYPATIRTRGAIPTGPAGWHPSIWSLQIPGNAYCYNGSEHGFECNGSTYTSAYEDPHTNGSVGSNSGTVNIGSGIRDGAPHDLVWDGTAANTLTYFADGAQVNQLTSSNTLNALPSYALYTSHIVNTFQGEVYSASAWATAGAAGANLDVFGVQVWVPTGGKVYTPLTSIADVLCVPGQTISITLPTTLALWGAASVTDQVICLPVEQEEPGNSASGWVGAAAGAGLPAWLSYNAGTRTLSGTVPAVGNGSVNVSGALNMVVGYCPSGNACNPATFRIVVAPSWTGSTMVTLTQGVSGSVDLYAGWNFGRDFKAGNANKTAAKQITATSIPAGMTLGTNGTISGAPTTITSYTVTTTSTNNDGQQTSQSITVNVQAAAGPIAGPAVSAGTVVVRYDPNDPTKSTLNGSSVTALADADGRSVTIANAGTLSTCPTLVTRNGKQALRFTAANSQFLSLATNLGIPGNPITIVIVFEHATTATSQAVFDLATAGGGNINVGRHLILSSTSSGVSYRKADNSGTPSVASIGTSVPAGVHTLVARGDIGTSFAKVNLDTTSGPIVASVSGASPTENQLTLGAAQTSGGKVNYFDGWIYATEVFSTLESDTDTSVCLSWGSSNWGSP